MLHLWYGRLSSVEDSSEISFQGPSVVRVWRVGWKKEKKKPVQATRGGENDHVVLHPRG